MNNNFCVGKSKRKRICHNRMNCLRYILGEKTTDKYSTFIVPFEINNNCEYFIDKTKKEDIV